MPSCAHIPLPVAPHLLSLSCPSPSGARAMACRLGWSHGMAVPSSGGCSCTPWRAQAWCWPEGMDAAGAVQPVPTLPASPPAAWVLLCKSSLASDWISVIVCAHWSVADKMKLCLQTPIGTNSTLK